MIILDNGTTSQNLIHEFHNYVSGQHPLVFAESLFTCYEGTFLGEFKHTVGPIHWQILPILGGTPDSTKRDQGKVLVGACSNSLQAGAPDTQLQGVKAANASQLSPSPENCLRPNRSHLALEAMSPHCSPDLSQWLTDTKGKLLLSAESLRPALWCGSCSDFPWGQAEGGLRRRSHSCLVFLLWPVLVLTHLLLSGLWNKSHEEEPPS